MTDTDPTPTPPLDTDACEAKAREQARLSESIHAADKAALFDALARAGITIVTVSFDGYGDSGQIEEIQAKAGDAPVELPAGKIELLQTVHGSAEAERSTLDISGAIEGLVYDFLEDTHSGWGNNDGAYGDFTFDVAERTITLDYNERFTQSEHFYHEF
jgi:hypothetical protein